MENASTPPTARSILVRLTVDEDRELLITTANGVPRRLKPEKAHAQLVLLALDTSIPEAKMEQDGFSFKDALNGIGQLLADQAKGGDQR